METSFQNGARAHCAAGAEPLLASLSPDPARPTLLSARALLERVFALEPASFLREVPGRQTFAWPADGVLVVKRFEGDAARERWYELCRGRAPRSPGRREFENLIRLAGEGFAVPRGLVWVEERGARGRSGVVMERVPHETTLRERLAAAGPGERRVVLRDLASLVARLHGAGWFHRDLYLQHFVCRDEGTGPVLLDVGRARRERSPRRRWFVKDLAALLHSCPDGVGAAERLRFLCDYLRGRGGDGRAERRSWTRAVLAKERRLAAHAPRHVFTRGEP